MKHEETFLLYFSAGNPRNVNIKTYKSWVKEKKQVEIADFIVDRFRTRYILPVKNSNSKNGFAMMACSCLLIETLQSFYDGKAKSNNSFTRFFTETTLGLTQFKDFNFHDIVRNGILHQGEIKNGYRILRKGKLFDASSRSINAALFLKFVDKDIQKYGERLKTSDWYDEIWNRFRDKMDSIIINCKHNA